MITIKVALDFSEIPGPRSIEEGDFSGEEFLNSHLRPKFDEATAAGVPLMIDLDGTEGYATSFLEAAFGGLSRDVGADKLLKTLKFRSLEEPYLVEEIKAYITEASVD